jgi:hypothetical protein
VSVAPQANVDTTHSSPSSSPVGRARVAWLSTAAEQHQAEAGKSSGGASMPGTPGTPSSPALRGQRGRMQSALRKPNKDFADATGAGSAASWQPGGERLPHATKHITFMLDNDMTSGKWKARSMPVAPVGRKGAGTDGLAALADGRMLQREGPGATTRGVRQRRVAAVAAVSCLQGDA